MTGRFKGKTAVVTGGASGIGAAAARLFVKEGGNVIIADILDTEGEKLSNELEASATFIHTDVTSEADIKRATMLAKDQYGRLDCLFNNAGAVGVGGAIDETDTQGLDSTIAILLRSVVLGIKHAASMMKLQGYGTIINSASIAPLLPGDAPHVYTACKGAVILLTQSVAIELAQHGIRVNCICPGFISTPIFQRELGVSEERAPEMLAALEKGMSQRIPMGRGGTSEEVAEAVLWLASDASSYVNGHHLVIDGGLSLGYTGPMNLGSILDSVARDFKT